MNAYWITDMNGEIEVNRMTSDHIINCIHYLESGKMIRPGCNGFTNVEWIKIFRTELQRRSRQQR